MTKSMTRRIIALVITVIAVAVMVLGAVCMPMRTNAKGQQIISDLQIRSLLNATGDGVVESYVAVAKREAQAKAKADGLGMSGIRAAVAQAEEEARARYSNTQIDLTGVNTDPLRQAVDQYSAALAAFFEAETASKNEYIRSHYDEAKAAMEADRAAKLERGEEVSEDETVTVDMSGYVMPAAVEALQTKANEAYLAVGEALKQIYPVLDDTAIATLSGTIQSIVYQ